MKNNIIKKITLITAFAGAIFVMLPSGVDTATTYPTGTLLKQVKYPTVYYVASDGRRYPFPDAGTYYTWKSDFSEVIELSKYYMRKVGKGHAYVTTRPGKRPVKFVGDPKVYVVSEGGHLHWILNETVAKDIYGQNWNKLITELPRKNIESYVFGEDITDADQYNKRTELRNAKSVQSELVSRDALYKKKVYRSWRTASVPRDKPALKALSENISGSLVPRFKPEITAYTLNTPYENEEVTFKFKTYSANSKIFVNDTIIDSGMKITLKLKEGKNNIDIRVVDEKKQSITYSIRLNRLPPDDNNLLKGFRENLSDKISPKFDPDILEYDISAQSYEEILKLRIYKRSTKAKVYVNGKLVKSRYYTNISLDDGKNTVRIAVIAQNGDIKTYKIHVDKANKSKADDAKLKSLRINLKDKLDPQFDPDIGEFNVEATQDENRITVSASPVLKTSTIYINGKIRTKRAINLVPGFNQVKIVSESLDGSKVVHIINIEKARN